ncbi:hypothetical protein SAMN04488589_1222 [Methanolobus vulcani]|uniref:Uncharacterized protein n=1 Tax=Methanolobus vulcani TaxID=38026 RepID=A0A7Z7AW24_9EURY|nr:hypothetical protein [Methanolobus vulcani]SDF71840.1 hypothetical protein SAMN04488589_1222 [Methanolobus vulcani]
MVVTNKMWKHLMILFLVSLLSIGYASAATEAFEEYAEDPHFITSKGTFTDTIDQEWRNIIHNCCASLPDSYSYYKFDEAIRTFACSEFIIVELKSEYKGEINDSRIDKLYQKIEAHCEENTGLSEVPVVFMWAEDEEYLKFEYDPDAFEKAKDSSGFVASMGHVPVFADEDEWLKWSEKVHKARHVFELESHFASQDGPLLSFGFKKYSGYIEVGVNKETPDKVNDSSLNEIYLIIEEHFEEAGISDIPVVFVWDMPLQTDEALVEEIPPMEEDSSQTVENTADNETTENGEETSQTTPGFTSIMLILCLLIISRFTK